jgi:hypothetical protein
VQLREIITRVDDFAARVRAGFDALSWLERRQIICTLVTKVEIDEKGATILYRLPSYERSPGSLQGGDLIEHDMAVTVLSDALR